MRERPAATKAARIVRAQRAGILALHDEQYRSSLWCIRADGGAAWIHETLLSGERGAVEHRDDVPEHENADGASFEHRGAELGWMPSPCMATPE